MGTYMTVVLREKYKQEFNINKINTDLFLFFGANQDTHFGTRQQLQEEANFLNHDPEGLTFFPGWKRPIAAKDLAATSFWLRVGEFSCKISGIEDPQEARNAVAVCKWIIATGSTYISTRKSSYYEPAVIQEYVNPLFEAEGHDPQLLWEQPLLLKNILSLTTSR
jgi:hypothetical protein